MSKKQEFCIGVKAIIEQGGKVLLLKDKDYQKWEFPGGRIDQGQEIEEALSREIGEETPGAILQKWEKLFMWL